MIIKNDESHLQVILKQAVDADKIGGTAACRILCEALSSGRFKQDGNVKKRHRGWFQNMLTTYPMPSRKKIIYKFQVGDIVEMYDDSIKQMVGTEKHPIPIVQVRDRFAKGKIIDSKTSPDIVQPQTCKENTYIVSFIPQQVQVMGLPKELVGMTFIIEESLLKSIDPDEVKKLFRG